MIINYQDLDKSILEELRKESLSSDDEICGFLIKKNNNYYFKKMINIHPNPKSFFLISPKESNYSDGGIVFHSHPEHVKEKGFSEWDLENQKYFYLPMLLYSVNNDEFYYKNI